MEKPRGKLQDEYEWAQAHPQTQEGFNFLNLVDLYRAHPDNPTLGLLQGAADEIRRLYLRKQ